MFGLRIIPDVSAVPKFRPDSMVLFLNMELTGGTDEDSQGS
jgi:hypothetical protein